MKKFLTSTLLLAILSAFMISCNINADDDLSSASALFTVVNQCDSTISVHLADVNWNLYSGNDIYNDRHVLTKTYKIKPEEQVTIPVIISKIKNNRALALMVSPQDGSGRTWWQYYGSMSAFYTNIKAEVSFSDNELFVNWSHSLFEEQIVHNAGSKAGSFDVINSTEDVLYVQYTGHNWNSSTSFFNWNSIVALSKRVELKPGEKITFDYYTDDFNKKSKINAPGVTYWAPYVEKGNRTSVWREGWELDKYPKTIEITVDNDDNYKTFVDTPASFEPFFTVKFPGGKKDAYAYTSVDAKWESLEINFDQDYSDVIQIQLVSDIYVKDEYDSDVLYCENIPATKNNVLVFADILKDSKYGLKAKGATEITAIRIQNLTETPQVVDVMKCKVTKQDGTKENIKFDHDSYTTIY